MTDVVGPDGLKEIDVSEDPLSFIALLLVLVLLALIGGICVLATVRSHTKADRALFITLACCTTIAFVVTIALLR